MEEYVPQFKFEKLQVWQKAMDFGEGIFSVSGGFPKDELFNLISQARRGADFIALNIAEGSISQSNPEYKKFLGYAIRSLAEVVTCIHIAARRKNIDQEQFNTIYAVAFHLMNMMQSFKSKIN